MSSLSLPTERGARLAALTRLHSAWENLWLAARGADPQWTARNAERGADEARVRRPALKMFREVTRMFGTSDFLARLGQRLWDRTGKVADPRMIASLKRALLARVDEKAMEKLRRGVVHELARAAERSESWTRDSLGVGPLPPWRGREGFRKQVSEWTDVEGVFVQEYPELVNEINGNLTTAVGSHAEQVSHSVVNATNPARPRPIGEVSRDIRQQLPGMSARRSNMIARTETTRSYGRTTHEQYKRNGIERRRTLTAAGSPAATLSPVCAICIDMAAQGWNDIDSPFESRVSSVSADYAPYHPYCRCDTTGDVEGWQPPMEDLGPELDSFEKMPMAERQQAWGKLSVRARDKIADPIRSITARRQEILSKMPARQAGGSTKQAIARRVDQSKNLVSADSRQIAQRHVDDFAKQMGRVKADPELTRRMSLDMVDDLVVQEFEATGRTLGDHGIRHLVGDSDMAIDILKAMPGSTSASDIAMMRYTGAYHDIGYLSRPARIFLDEGHLRWSKAYVDSALRANAEKAFGKAGFRSFSRIVATHDSVVMNWAADPLASAFRVSDNLALFHKKKLPQLFNMVPKNVKTLARLGAEEISVTQAQTIMTANIEASTLSQEIKTQLLRATAEVSKVLPKFTVGQFGGEVRGFAWAEDHLVINLKRTKLSKFDQALNRVVDMGQAQFKKLSDTYNVAWDDWRQSSNMFVEGPRGVPMFEVRVTGSPLRVTPGRFQELQMFGGYSDFMAKHRLAYMNNRAVYSTAERRAMATYKKDGYSKINSALRGKRVADAKGIIKGRIDQLNSALLKQKMPGDVVVYRGVGGRMPRLSVDNLRVGDVISDKAFMSTSSRASAAQDWGVDVFKIQVPKGTPCIPLERLPKFQLDLLVSGEAEFVLPSGMRLQVVEVYKTREAMYEAGCRALLRVVEVPKIPALPKAKFASFTGDTAQLKFAKRNFVPRVDKLFTAAEQEALTYYKGHGYNPINNALRGIAPNLEQGNILTIKTAVGKQRLKQNVKLYRGISERVAKITKLGDVKIGTIIEDKAFMSASIDRRMVQKWKMGTTLEINAPKGTKALWLERSTDVVAQGEVLLQPGTKMRVVDKFLRNEAGNIIRYGTTTGVPQGFNPVVVVEII